METSNYIKTKRLFKDVYFFSIATFGSKILMFLLTPMYTALLTTEEYGIADLITITINLAYPLLTLSIAESTLRFSLDTKEDNRKVFSISILFTVASVLLLLCFYPVLNLFDVIYREYWVVFIITYLLINVHNTFSYFVKGIGKTKVFAVQGIVFTGVFVVLNIVFLLIFKWGLNGYLWSTIISYIVSILIMFFWGGLYRYFKNFEIDSDLLKKMLKYSIPMIPVLLGTLINNNIDKYMIIGMVNLGESGIYSVAHKIPSIYTAVLSVFVQAWQISAIENNDDADQSGYFTSVYRGADLLGIIGCILIIMSSKGLASFLFSSDFYIGWKYVPMLIIAAMFMGNANILSAAYRAEKNTVPLFVSVAIGCGLNIFLNIAFIYFLGALGAAIATAISSFVIWLIRMIFVQKILKIDISVISVVISYIILFICALVTMYEASFWLACCALGLTVILGVNSKEIIHLLKATTRFLKKRI